MLAAFSKALPSLPFFTKNATVCDTVGPLATPFDAASYMGTWYNIQHSTGAAFQPDWFDCTTALYSDLDAETATFTVYNSSSTKLTPRFGVTGSASCANTPNG